MKCEDCQKVLEEYFDGELEERETLEVRAHLSACAGCAQELEVLRDEANLYALYRRDVEVSPALWNGVAKRIHEERSASPESQASGWRERLANLFGTPRLSPALTFALVILAVGATAGLMKLMQSSRTAETTARSQSSARTGQGTPAPSTAKENQGPAPEVNAEEQGTTANAGAQEPDEEDGAGRKSESVEKPARTLSVADRTAESRRNNARPEGYAYEDSPEELVREAEQKYRAAIALLSRDARRRRTLLEPDVLARFDQTLAAVDRTIDETRRAARRQPEDPVAVQYMLAAYAKKVEVLREMAAYRVDDRGIQ